MTRALAAVTVVALAACGSTPSVAVAELVAADGTVDASQSHSPQRWRPSHTGARYHTGDGVRTGVAASARVRLLRGNGVLHMGPESLLRFGAELGGIHPLQLETGEATIEAIDTELAIETAGGPTRVRPGAVVRVLRDGGGIRLEVVVGEAVIERAGGATLVVVAGQTVDVPASGEVISRPAPPPASDDDTVAAERAGAVAAERADAGRPSSDPAALATRLELHGRPVTPEPPPTAVCGGLSAGETAVVHAPSTPAELRISVGDECPDNAIVEVRSGKRRRFFRGQSAVDVALTAGRNRYRLYCNDAGTLRAGKLRGTIRVVRDSGRRTIRTRAPRNQIEADGRNYRLLYQNRKPTIDLVWPRAPSASGYQVIMTSATGKQRSFQSDSPRYSIRSGTLAEGAYTWQFRTSDGVAQSLESRLLLDFDNASPALQLSSVKWTATGVEIRGLATAGSTITIGGSTVSVDDDYRFAAHAKVPPGADGVAIRIVRPAGDLHYYQVKAPSRQ